MQMWFAGEYREVVENERLVYSEYISDENGNVLPPADMGMPDGHPMVTEVRVDLQDVGGRTNMAMTHSGIPGGPRAQRDGRWRSQSWPPTWRRTASDNAEHLRLAARTPSQRHANGHVGARSGTPQWLRLT